MANAAVNSNQILLPLLGGPVDLTDDHTLYRLPPGGSVELVGAAPGEAAVDLIDADDVWFVVGGTIDSAQFGIQTDIDSNEVFIQIRDTGSVRSSGEDGIKVRGSDTAVVNFGFVESTAEDGISLNSSSPTRGVRNSVVNHGTIAARADGIVARGDDTRIANFGTITSQQDGIDLGQSASGTSVDVIRNDGTIEAIGASGGAAVLADGSGTVMLYNRGELLATTAPVAGSAGRGTVELGTASPAAILARAVVVNNGLISGVGRDGIQTTAGAVEITNRGTITSADDDGIVAEAVEVIIENQRGGLIATSVGADESPDGIAIDGPGVNLAPGFAFATISNAGTITHTLSDPTSRGDAIDFDTGEPALNRVLNSGTIELLGAQASNPDYAIDGSEATEFVENRGTIIGRVALREGDDVYHGIGRGAVSGIVDAGDGDDSLTGGAVDDRLAGGAGDDTLDGGGGLNELHLAVDILNDDLIDVGSVDSGDDVILDFDRRVSMNDPAFDTLVFALDGRTYRLASETDFVDLADELGRAQTPGTRGVRLDGFDLVIDFGSDPSGGDLGSVRLVNLVDNEAFASDLLALVPPAPSPAPAPVVATSAAAAGGSGPPNRVTLPTTGGPVDLIDDDTVYVLPTNAIVEQPDFGSGGAIDLIDADGTSLIIGGAVESVSYSLRADADSDGTSIRITADGSVDSEGSSAIRLDGTGNRLANYGSIVSRDEDGITIGDPSDPSVGNKIFNFGSIEGREDGIDIAGQDTRIRNDGRLSAGNTTIQLEQTGATASMDIIRNRGTVETTGNFDPAISALGNGTVSLNNVGQILATRADFGRVDGGTVTLGGIDPAFVLAEADVVNRGVISGVGRDGIFASAQTVLIANKGTISSVEEDGIRALASKVQIVNRVDGIIAVSIGNESDSDAIEIDDPVSQSATDRTFTTIENSGTVTNELTSLAAGGDAIDFDTGALALNRVVNNGRIELVGASASQPDFAIDGSEGIEVVENRGTIVGRIALREGDDVYLGLGGGSVSAIVDGGSDDDRLTGSAADDRLAGGGGNDTLDGGGGRNELYVFVDAFNDGLIDVGTEDSGDDVVVGFDRRTSVDDSAFDTLVFLFDGRTYRLSSEADFTDLANEIGRSQTPGTLGVRADGADLVIDFGSDPSGGDLGSVRLVNFIDNEAFASDLL